jgi:hypothetical protein
MTDDDMTPDARTAKALDRIATGIKYLGTGDNADQRGAVEYLAIQMKEGLERLAGAVDEHSVAVERGLASIANAIDRVVDEGVNGIVTEEIASAVDDAAKKIGLTVANLKG